MRTQQHPPVAVGTKVPFSLAMVKSQYKSKIAECVSLTTTDHHQLIRSTNLRNTSPSAQALQTIATPQNAPPESPVLER